MIFWDRQANLIINGNMYNSDSIDIEFNVSFSTENEPDISEISIYNLSKTSVASIKKGTKVSLTAGYGKNIGLLTQGQVSDFTTIFEGVDKKTTLKIAPAINEWKDLKVHKTYAKGTTSKDIFADLISMFGVTVGDLSPVKDVTYQKGKVVSGRLKDVIKNLALETESKFYIDKNRAYVRAYESGTNTGFLLSRETGLVGSPEKCEITEGNNKSNNGWKVESLLNHNIFVDSLIQIKSKVVSGTFRVVKGTHTSEWLTKMEVVSV